MRLCCFEAVSAILKTLTTVRPLVSQQTVQAYILGEHGDSSFPALTQATVGGVPLTDFPSFSSAMTATIDQDIRESAYKISIFPVCVLAQGEYGLDEVVIGLPSLVSSEGARIIDKYPLSSEETKLLQSSAKIIKDAIKSANDGMVE